MTFSPAQALFAGELVNVQFGKSVTAANATTLRAAGYAIQFVTVAGASPMAFTKIDTVSVRTHGNATRLYGGA